MLPAGVEILNSQVRRGRFRAVLFDFDGTLSLIREGWPRVMVGMMVEILRDLKLAAEPEVELWGIVEHFVMALNGHPTVVQMARFAEEVRARGGDPDAPTVYLRGYLDRLMSVVQGRWDSLESGKSRPEDWVVPGAHAILGSLQRRGLPLYLASGTDLEAVRHEGNLLRVLPAFGEHVYAPKAGDTGFSKVGVIESILDGLGIRGEELLGFGDGVVETQEVKRVGGVMVGVASVEAGQPGRHAGKRDTLAAAGADLIIADYREQESLLRWLLGES
jgi:phosphoglycolate phosphatase-like HAD superfamily hydrolase